MAESDANTTPGSAPFVGTMDTEPGDNANEKDNTNDNALVLTCDQLQQVNDFRNQLLSTTNNASKFQLYTEKCNKLLYYNTRLQILIAAYNNVILAAYHKYKSKKQEKTRTLLPTSCKKKTNNSAIHNK